MFVEKNATAALVEDALNTIGQFEIESVQLPYRFVNRTEIVDEQYLGMTTRALGRVELINSVVVDWQGEEPEAKHRLVIYSEHATGNIVLEPAQERAYLEGANDEFFGESEMAELDYAFAADLLEKIREAKFELDIRRMQIVMSARENLASRLESFVSMNDDGTMKYAYEGAFRAYDLDTFTDYSLDFTRVFSPENELVEELLVLDVSGSDSEKYLLFFDTLVLDIERMNKDENGEVLDKEIENPETVTYCEDAIAAYEIALKNMLI